ncbi:protein transport protein YIF1 [Pancytospora philotis]|nr:protein transport protein YIF1 [Pancytospora philotis]
MQYDLSKKAIESGAQYVTTQLERVDYGRLHKYFDVDNTFLCSKLRLLLLPSGKSGFEFYRPDLYVPAVSLFALLLLKSFVLGLHGRFHPETLCLHVTRHVCFHAIIVAVYKTAAYMCGSSFAMLDITALAGYKFAAALIIRLLRFLPLGWLLGMAPIVSFFFFMSRSLKQLLLHPGSPRTVLYLLFGLSLSEALLAYLFSG